MSKQLAVLIAAILAIVAGVFFFRSRATVQERGDEAVDLAQVSYRKKSGDFMQFFGGEFQRYGGTQSAVRILPALRGDWSYAEDTNGFQILLSRDRQAEFVQCLTQAYGAPILSEGYPRLLYRSGVVGATIQAQTQLDPMHIIVTRAGTIHDERLPIGGKKDGQ